MVLEGFILNLANTLGIPLGAKRRKVNGNGINGYQDPELNIDESPCKDFINSIIDIAKDDVCVGRAPFFYQSEKKRISNALKDRCQVLCDALNKIAPWVATDLLKVGVSTYNYKVLDDKRIIFNPILTKCYYILEDDNSVAVYNEDGEKVENILVFIYYDKENLVLLEEGDNEGRVQIVPAGIQTKNLKQSLDALSNTEKSIARLRADTSRVVRFGTVEVGLNKGNNQQEIVDDISEGINANSMDLNDSTEFDDQIPIFPTRKGLGKPEYEEHFSQGNLSDLADLDYNLSKVTLAMRFPKSYADFSDHLSQSAVSMIRGDIRYAKLLTTCRSLMEETVNEWAKPIKELQDAKIVFKLTQVPSSEDDDVVQVLSGYTDFASAAWDYISQAESKEEAEKLLTTLKVLYSTSTNQEGVTKFLDALYESIQAKYDAQDSMSGPSEEGGSDFGLFADDSLADSEGATLDDTEDEEPPESEME